MTKEKRKLKGTGMICTDNVRILSMINGTCNLPMEMKRLTLVTATFTFEC